MPLDTPGITIRPIEDMTTNRHFCEVWYDDVRVPVANLVGEEGGVVQADDAPARARAGRHRPAALEPRALPRRPRARPIATDPRVRQEIARLETGYRLGRLLVLRETLGQAPRSFSAATKTFCTEHEQRVADFAARAFGADATLWGRAARAVCYAPAYTIMGGTSNVLRNIIGERVLGLPREPS